MCSNQPNRPFLPHLNNREMFRIVVIHTFSLLAAVFLTFYVCRLMQAWANCEDRNLRGGNDGDTDQTLGLLEWRMQAIPAQPVLPDSINDQGRSALLVISVFSVRDGPKTSRIHTRICVCLCVMFCCFLCTCRVQGDAACAVQIRSFGLKGWEQLFCLFRRMFCCTDTSFTLKCFCHFSNA